MKKILILLLTSAFVQLMSNDITWSFPPQTLSTNIFNASDPHISMDPLGNITAVWIQNGMLVSSSKLFNMPWGPLSVISSAGASSPRIVTAFNGNVTALWIQNGLINSAIKPLNSTWSTPIVLSNPGVSSPSLAIDNTGDIVAAWIRSDNVESIIKPFGGNWSPRTIISGISPATPVVSFGGNGTSRIALLVWQAKSNGSPAIFGAMRNLTSPWSDVQILSDPAHLAVNPHVAVDANGNASALWYAYDLLNNTICNVTVQSSSLPFQGDWSPLTTLSQPGIGNPSTLVARIAYDKLGNAMALWNTSFDNATLNIQTAMKPLYGSWMPATNIVTTNTYAYEADFSLSDFGDALSVYMFYNGRALITQATGGNISGFLNNLWSVPTSLSIGTQNGFPRVASGVVGNAINAAAVWISSNGTNTTVVASTGSKNLLSAPTNVSVTQQVNDFGVFNEYYNTVSWQASSDPSVIGYLIYRNGIFLGQASGLQYIDDNQPQNGAVIYGVAAINANNTTSKIINGNFP